REAPNYFYSRISLGVEEQTTAKRKFIEVARESRHFGLALGLDMIRYLSVEIDLRELSDYILFKALGPVKLDERLRWIFAYVNPFIMRNLPPQYALIAHEGNLAFAFFEYPWWHKKVEEEYSIFDSLGIKIFYEERQVDIEKQNKMIEKAKEEEVEEAKFVEEEPESKIEEKVNISSKAPAELSVKLEPPTKPVQKSEELIDKDIEKVRDFLRRAGLVGN
ncbi:MAG: hypothetical protein ACPLGZ_01560, partial [Candidatus Pelagibacter ubique]